MHGRQQALFWGAFALLLGLNLIWPGDTPFINDEPIFLQRALDANAAGVLPATAGMTGNAGIPYGGLAIWIYQGLLSWTTDLPSIVLIKTAVCQLILFLGLWSISKTCGWSLVPCFWVFLSPFFWLSSRLLWDNCFLVPLSALMLAAAVRFFRDERARDFWIVAIAATAMLLIHLMALAPVISLAFVLIRKKGNWLRKNPAHLAGALVLAGLLFAPYLRVLFHLPPSAHSRLALHFGNAAANTFLGFQFFTALGFDRYVPQVMATATPLFQIAAALSGLGLLFVFVGWGLTLIQKKSALSSLDACVNLYCVVTLTSVFFVNLLLNLRHHKHYLNPVWPVFFVLIARAVTRLTRFPAGRAMVRTHTGALAIFLVGTIVITHQTAGNRLDTYGTTLSEQIRIAHLLPPSGDLSRVVLQADCYQRFPHTIEFLAKLYGQEGINADGFLRYRDRDPNAQSGWLELVPR